MDSIPAGAEVYPLPGKIEKLRIEARPEKDWPFNWQSVLLFLICTGLLGWSVFTTENWLQGESRIPILQTAVESLGQEVSLIQAEKSYLTQRGSKLEIALHQKNKKYTALKLDARSLEREFAYAQKKINSLKAKIKEMASRPPKTSGIPLKPSTQGIIVRVNSIYEYAMINLGSEQGIHEGEDLFVVREGVIRGALRVDEAFENFSICNMWSKDPADSLQSGDLVVD